MPEIDFNHSLLFGEGARLPAIKSWLTGTVWARERYRQAEPDEYLRAGEAAECRLEELISTGSQQVWDELQAESQRAPTVKAWLGLDGPFAPTDTTVALLFDVL